VFAAGVTAPSAGAVPVGFRYVRHAWMRTCGECPATTSHGFVPIAARSFHFENDLMKHPIFLIYNASNSHSRIELEALLC